LQLGNVWIAPDNFESWLDEERRIADAEISVWFETALERGHQARLILTSQFLPVLSSRELQSKLKRLQKIDDGIDGGLPEPDALNLLRNKGCDCGLAEADETLLRKFIRGVHRIPSAMESLIGYLSEDENHHRITFAQVMRDAELQAAFQSPDREAGGQYLIKKQLARLKPEELEVLSAIAFFGMATPREVLLAEERQLTAILNRLEKNRLLSAQGDSFGVWRYTVQTYIAQNEKLQTISLPSDYADELMDLGVQAYEKASHRLASDLFK